MLAYEEPHRPRLNEGDKRASDVIIGAGKPGGKQSSHPGEGGEFDVGLCLQAASWETAGLRLSGKRAPSCQLKSTDFEVAFG